MDVQRPRIKEDHTMFHQNNREVEICIKHVLDGYGWEKHREGIGF